MQQRQCSNPEVESRRMATARNAFLDAAIGAKPERRLKEIGRMLCQLVDMLDGAWATSELDTEHGLMSFKVFASPIGRGNKMFYPCVGFIAKRDNT